MRTIFTHIGNNEPDYRALMATQKSIVLNNREIPFTQVVIAQQTHSAHVHVCQPADSGAGTGSKPQIQIADGFVTNITNQFLLIRTADCTPVLLYDESNFVVGAIHSGREGTRKNICGRAIEIMVSVFGCQVSNIKLIIGPGICEKHYEVSQEIWEEYNQTFIQAGIPLPETKSRHIDVRSSIQNQALFWNVPKQNIKIYDICTYESENYFSFRRNGTMNRQINLIGVIDE